MNKPNIYSILKDLDIEYSQYDHPAVYTCEEADKHYSEVPGGRSKNLFLRDRKGKNHFLVVMSRDKQLDLKKLEEVLGMKKLTFASAERLMKYLGVTPGSVTPFGIIHDVNKEVTVIVDKDTLAHETVHFHPLVNTATLVIKSADLLKFLEAQGNEVRVEEI